MIKHWRNMILTVIAGVMLSVSGCGNMVSAPSETVKEQENVSASESITTPEETAGEDVTDEIKEESTDRH